MAILITLILVQFAVSTTLSVLNLSHLKRAAKTLPTEWSERLDVSQFPAMIAYSTAHSRLNHVARSADLAVTLALLLSGLLPALVRWASALALAPVWQGLIVLAIPVALSYLFGIPWDLLSRRGYGHRFPASRWSRCPGGHSPGGRARRRRFRRRCRRRSRGGWARSPPATPARP